MCRRRQCVPDGPEVHVAVVILVRRLLEIGTGRTRSVGYGIGIIVHGTLKNVSEHHHVILPDALAHRTRHPIAKLLPVSPMQPASFHLIVAAPHDDTGMLTQSLDLIDRFVPHALLKRHISGNHIATEHESFPASNAKCVAAAVEMSGIVMTAAPL